MNAHLHPRPRVGAAAVAIAGVAACLLAGPAATPGRAADMSGAGVVVKVRSLSGRPSAYFDLGAHPGTTLDVGSLELVNPSDRRIIVRLGAVDALTTDTLGSAYALRASRSGPASWVRLSRRSVSLPPRAHVDVGVSARIPRGTSPGDYLGGIAVQSVGAATTTKPAGGVAIGEVERYAIGVELKLPGARHPAIRLTGARVEREPSRLAFLLLARNVGNVILKNVHGEAIISRAGRVVARTSLGPGTFVTNTAIAYPVAAAPSEMPAAGTRYRVQAVLRYRGGATRLNTAVTFGHAAAVVQQSYGGPAAGGGGGGLLGLPIWALIAIGAGVLLVLALATRRLVGGPREGRPSEGRARRATRPRRGQAAHEQLAQGLAGARATGPVSIVRLALNGTWGAERRRVSDSVAGRLRPSDSLLDLDALGLVLVLPDTFGSTATVLAMDLGAMLVREGVALERDALGVATATEPMSAAAVLDRVTPVYVPPPPPSAAPTSSPGASRLS